MSPQESPGFSRGEHVNDIWISVDVETTGAFPGIEAEARGQAEAIARSIEACLEAPVPVIATIIGEGGSGGALAIAVGDVTLMLQYATYSVISPEGCASILWKSADHAPEAAEIMGINLTKYRTLSFGLAAFFAGVGGALQRKQGGGRIGRRDGVHPPLAEELDQACPLGGVVHRHEHGQEQGKLGRDRSSVATPTRVHGEPCQ